MELRAMREMAAAGIIRTGHLTGGLARCTRDYLRSRIDMVNRKEATGWITDEARALADSDAAGGRVYSGTGTNIVEDRYESIIHTDGGQTANWEANPVIYLEHGWCMGGLPIGRGIALIKMPSAMEVAFVTAINDDDADRAANLIDQRMMRSLSVSFDPRRSANEEVTVTGADGKTATRWVRHYYEWDLLEFSPVGIPGNQTCTDLVANSATGAQRYATPADKARALSAQLYEMVIREKVDLATMRHACTRVLALYGLTPDDAGIAQRAIDFQLNFADLIDKQPPNSLQRNLLCEALLDCLNNPLEVPDPVTAASAVEGAR